MWKIRLTQFFLKASALYLVSALSVSAALEAQGPQGEAVIMTQNQYLGADLVPIITASTPAGYNLAVLDAIDQMAQNSAPERMARLAESIVDKGAHLVSLQEVFRTSCVESGTIPGACSWFSAAMNDHLDLTLDALDALGASYEVAAVVDNLVIPAAGFPLPGLPVFLDADDIPDVFIQALDRDVILARSDVPTSVVYYPCSKPSRDGCNYAVFGSAPTLAGNIDMNRGFVAVDATIDGSAYRLVNTHLEIRYPLADPDAPLIQAGQASQLIQTLAAVPAPPDTDLLLTGDINSAPNDPVFVSTYGPAYPPYQQLAQGVNTWGQPVGNAYLDLWDAENDGRRSNTCCQAADLSNQKSNHDERIDVIFAQQPPPFAATHTVNDQQRDKTASGLWPSDHASVVARLHHNH